MRSMFKFLRYVIWNWYFCIFFRLLSNFVCQPVKWNCTWIHTYTKRKIIQTNNNKKHTKELKFCATPISTHPNPPQKKNQTKIKQGFSPHFTCLFYNLCISDYNFLCLLPFMYILYFYIYLISTSLLASLCMLAFALTRRAHNQSIIVNRVCLFGVIIDKPFGSSFFYFYQRINITYFGHLCNIVPCIFAFLRFVNIPTGIEPFFKNILYSVSDVWFMDTYAVQFFCKTLCCNWYKYFRGLDDRDRF